MNTPPNIQTIEQDGKPAFAVIPYDEYLKLFPEEAAIPHKVAGAFGLSGEQARD